MSHSQSLCTTHFSCSTEVSHCHYLYLFFNNSFFPTFSSIADLEEDKVPVCLSVCVLSTLVFLLALCCFHIEEEGNKK